MKRIFQPLIRIRLFILASIVFLLSACSKDEPDPPVQPMYGVPSGEFKSFSDSSHQVNSYNKSNETKNDEKNSE